ncbi:uncharacterized protein RCC_03821 [Ramularia collo-cygni]|uniref:Uncharacterized protein n=1 Tax=Ramularia collo-cygni TaxID=112498 RepID=A0A2D3UNY2_9PEZI|nr:uncharacterized protein RCC_03821 [Ramularia collo-cygni]CZT17982.1 uncharacterized protein RCC_03821 [Ramularia collo-cygni]
MSAVQHRQGLRPHDLQLQTKSEFQQSRRPSTPGSPEDLASLSIRRPDYTSRFNSWTNPSTVDLEQLRGRLNNLPQELYDEIMNFTLVCDAGNDTFPSSTKNGSPIVNAQYIDETYRPPVQLAINHKIRQETLKDFYGRTTFIFSDHGVLKRWMRSLPIEAMAEIRQARVVEATASCIFTGIYTRPERAVGKPKIGGDIWKTWDLSIETRQSCAGKSTRAQEFATVARNWYKWH